MFYKLTYAIYAIKTAEDVQISINSTVLPALINHT